MSWQSGRMTIRSDNIKLLTCDWEKTHNIYCLLEKEYTEKLVIGDIAKFLRESRIAKALTDKTRVYESHIKINVGVVRRVLGLGDSDNDPTIIPERLAKGLWCRMGFTGHINGKILKVSHRKGACDETSDYIMKIITCLILNRPYNVSHVIFDYMAENARAGNKQYIMYPRFVQMMIDDQVKDLEKSNDDILGLRHMSVDTISRLIKGPNPGAKRKICKIKTLAYVAPENDAWRHQDNDSDNENEKRSDMVEKKTRWWFVRDGKRKRTPKTSPAVPIPKELVPKIVIKGTVRGGVIRKLPQQRLIDETVLEPSEVIKQGADLLKQILESYLKRNEEVAAQKDQGSSAQAENVKVTEPEGETQEDSSEDDSEATQSESELDPTTLGRGKAQLNKKPTKKQKASDEEDSSYEPDEPKKQIKKRKAVQAGMIPRRVRAKNSGAEPPKDKGGKKEKHIQKSKIHEAEKKKTGGDDDYVEITGYKAATPPRPPPQDHPESSHPKDTKFDYIFEGLPTAIGIYTEDIPEDDYNMFNNEAVNELLKKVADLEKAKAKAEKERDILKQQVEQLMKAHDEIRLVLIDQEETLNKMKNEAHDNSKVFELLTAEISSLNVKIKNLEDVNQIVNQLLSEMSEASSNEMKVIKL
ncbi:hypothetical protein Hanom_Chr09g00789391 [Helianthus anomalus]